MSQQIMILNLTQSTFFRYYKESNDDKGYNRTLRDLTTPHKPGALSHWDKHDKIVFVPEHLYGYVNKTYGELFDL